jgi:L-seryl-tRNA(Ser) seleniumtransferase
MDPRASIPGVDRLLELAPPDLRREHLPSRLTEALRHAVGLARRAIPEGSWAFDPADPVPYLAAARQWLQANVTPSLRPVINATGVVLHTNLGRAPLAPAARAAMDRVAAGYTNLEYDLGSGTRGSRYDHCAALVAELTGAEDALVVNNCAGGLVLALAALARGRDVLVSRGEMVEIGGGFRIPEVLEQAGAGLREVGATNRTRTADYEAALAAGGVAAILKVHRSNFRISGFTEEATLQELRELARSAEVPLIHDLGSGLLADPGALGLPPEPTPMESLAAGADLVVFSGDKLLGGPQAGLVAGSSGLVARLRKNPLCRALRVDKATLAGLEATLRLYRDPERVLREVPALALLARTPEDLRRAANELAESLRDAAEAAGVRVSLEEGTGRVGGGTYPEHPLPGWVVRVAGGEVEAGELAGRLREGSPPVVGRVEDDALILDVRAVLPGEEGELAAAVRGALSPGAGG